jgi:ceramide glucosyltransferase
MIAVLHALGEVALGWALVAGSVEIEAIRRSLFRRRVALPPDVARHARVLIVRPCAGHEPWLADTLRSLAEAKRSFSLACRFAIADARDTALPAARAAAEALSAAGIDAGVILTGARGPNRKAEQLAAAIAEAGESFDIVLVADSDVDLAGTDLDALVAPLVARPDLAAVWAPPVEAGRAATLGDRASAALLSASLHAFPILALLDKAGLVGKLFAVRRDALAAAGGFGALTSHLGEDMELARRLLAEGRRVEAAPIVARSRVAGRSWEQVAGRFARWITVIRAQRPALLASYPLLFFPTVPIVLLAALAAPAAPLFAATAALAALLARFALALTATHASGRRASLARVATDALLADALLASAFLRALRSRTVVWRDVVLRIDRGGLLRLASPRPR